MRVWIHLVWPVHEFQTTILVSYLMVHNNNVIPNGHFKHRENYVTQVQGDYMPIVREKPTMELVKLTSDMKLFKAYNKIRQERTTKRHAGARAKRAAEA
ncbi:Large ribosomal subunit protein eL13y [Cardamine amara subsp. amara]|uniref:Large ribosomal subunit protein eL13y n=1 Tax=Cardamine amara subsp. amara TaxID=228776 RepID=A0ABD0ZK23_CARAN